MSILFRRSLATARVLMQEMPQPTQSAKVATAEAQSTTPSPSDASTAATTATAAPATSKEALEKKYTPRQKPLPSIFTKTPIDKKVSVNPKHGLYAFFERRAIDTSRGELADGTGDGKQISSTLPTWTESQSLSSRAWRASELRLKSFEDLHTLWYILLRERNLLSTQLEEARRLGVDIQQSTRVNERRWRVRKSMSRIKYVLSERHHAIISSFLYKFSSHIIQFTSSSSTTIMSDNADSQNTSNAPLKLDVVDDQIRRQKRGKQLANAAVQAMNDVQAIEKAKKTQDLVELKLTFKMTEGAVSKDNFKGFLKLLSSASLSRIEHERHLADLCAYPPCSNPPQAPYTDTQSQLRIDRASLSVYTQNTSVAFCSRRCEQRETWARTKCVGKVESDTSLLVDIDQQQGGQKLLEEFEGGSAAAMKGDEHDNEDPVGDIIERENLQSLANPPALSSQSTTNNSTTTTTTRNVRFE
ncbi:hypothetical protein E3P99_01581 [Wallemia hederae]|uniref:Large ribosomal subunit protein uL29m n=1 Tax=Wallemia hederae TaxID=1540922 RepID=A0A4T0FPV4_9BASI|nr:hypothetical protein E3P99_01581 [Wallemia hederae]